MSICNWDNMRDDSKAKFYNQGLMVKESIRYNKNLVDTNTKHGNNKYRLVNNSYFKSVFVILCISTVVLVILNIS